jgi:hypothetical protein
LVKEKKFKKGKKFLSTCNYKRHVWWLLPNSISLSPHVIHVHLPSHHMTLMCLIMFLKKCNEKKKKKLEHDYKKKEQFNNKSLV